MTRHPLPRWNDLNPPVMREDAASTIAVLPLGAHEQHGPHLPPQTDTIIADGLVSALGKAMPADLSVAFLPTEKIGYSVEHVDFGETETLAWDEAVQRWIDIAEMLHHFGIRKFLMLNAHGGNSPLMTVVATEARVRFDMLAVATSWTRFGLPPDTVGDEEKAFGIHAGEIETSVMLALRPDLVDMSKARTFPSFQEQLHNNAQFLRAYGPHAFGWSMRDLNADGATGNAANATAETGHKLIDHAVAGLIALLREIHAFDVGHFDRKK